MISISFSFPVFTTNLTRNEQPWVQCSEFLINYNSSPGSDSDERQLQHYGELLHHRLEIIRVDPFAILQPGYILFSGDFTSVFFLFNVVASFS